jgi:hypothetical protein
VGVHQSVVLSEGKVPVRDSVRRKLLVELEALRSVLTTEKGGRFLELFDEFVDHHEFELALHSVCDFVLASGSPPVATTTVDQILMLHQAMEIDDDCVEKIRNKVVSSG